MTAPLRLPPIAWIPGVTTWIVIWSVLASATIVLVVLMRTRWRQVKPWKKCALLSLWVHVLLACLAVAVRIGTSGGPGIGPGEGGPMRVAIISVDMTALEAFEAMPPKGEPEAAPVAEAPVESDPAPIEAMPVEPAPAPVAAVEEPTPAEPTTPPTPEPAEVAVAVATRETQPLLPTPNLALDAPDLLPQPEPDSAPVSPDAVVESAPEKVAEQTAAPEAKMHADATPMEAPASRSPTPPPTLGVPDGEVASATGAAQRPMPSAYANRFADREAMVAGGGGNPTTERAVRAALAWLAASQEPAGRWDPKKFGAGQERYVLGENRGAAGARADTGITALALLAFLGAGHTHRDGPYADNIARGLDYLRREQGPNGNLGGQAELFAHMYCHSMATFAVSEAAALTGDEKLAPMVRKAVAYSLAVQHPSDGGWRYRPGDAGDTSQLGWQLMALKSAELAGVDIPSVTWTRVDRFLRSVERGSAGGLAAYRPEGPPTRAMTAEALFCRQLITKRRDGGLPAAAMDEARKSLLQEPPGGPGVNFYYWYYATIALHRSRTDSVASEEAWERWNEELTSTLVGEQSNDGSWPATCMWGGYGGRVYTTALATMCLEVYYRYAPEDAAAFARWTDWQTVPAR